MGLENLETGARPTFYQFFFLFKLRQISETREENQLNNTNLVNYCRNKERGLAAVKELEAEGLRPTFHQLDISDEDSVKRLR